MPGESRPGTAPLHLPERGRRGQPSSKGHVRGFRSLSYAGAGCSWKRLPLAPQHRASARAEGRLRLCKQVNQIHNHLHSRCFLPGVVAQPVAPALGTLRREGRHDFQVSLGYSTRPCLKVNRLPHTKQNKKQKQHRKVLREAKPAKHAAAGATRAAARSTTVGGTPGEGGTSAPHFRFRPQMNSPATGKEQLSARVLSPARLLAG